MQEFGGTDACLREVGNLILPGYTASKVRWFRDTHPDLYSQMSCILLPHDYLNFYLSGERCMEAGDASGSGFLNVRTRQWSEEMLRAIDSDRDLRECLPEVRTANELIGYLLQPIALELGLPSGVPISVGGGDNMMAAIGTGNVASGIVTVSLGTSGTVFAYADQPVLDPKGDIAAFCSSTGGWLPLLCTMNCTVSTDLIRNLVGADMKVFESQAASAVPGSDGVLTVPFFNGERTPNLPNARGAILGLNSQNTNPSNLMRSAIEGATYALRFGIDEMRSLGISATEVVLTGGGANSATWRQVAADVFNVPVTTLKNSEGAAFGAALQALAMLDGGNANLSALTDQHLLRDEGKCCEPRQSAVTAYNESYAMYQQAVEGVAALYR